MLTKLFRSILDNPGLAYQVLPIRLFNYTRYSHDKIDQVFIELGINGMAGTGASH